MVHVNQRQMTGALRRVSLMSAGLLSVVASPVFAEGLGRDGRLLTWNNQPIQLVGYSYYGLLGDRQFDAEVFLENLAAHNINFTRFFLVLPWPVGTESNVLPFAKAGDKYDLRKFDETYFVRLRTIIAKAERLGIVCQVCLFDRCGLSVSDRRAWANNPYNAERNVNGLLEGPKDGYPPFCHTTGPIAKINAAFIRKVVETIGDRDNVIYEIMNEPYPQLGPLPEWHAWVARELRKHLADRSGSKVISSTGAYDDEEIDVFSMHLASSDRHVAAAIRTSRKLNKPVILSDDGDTRCMFHPDVLRSSAERALKLGQHFEHLGFAITLRRERERRPAARLDQIPAVCQLNLRRLAELAVPLPERPYLRGVSLENTNEGRVLSARVRRLAPGWQVTGQQSHDGGRTWTAVAVTQQGNVVTTAPLQGNKRTRNLIRFVMVDAKSNRWAGAPHPFSGADQWAIVLGGDIMEAGVMRIRPHRPDGVLRKVRRGGRNCYEVDYGQGGKFAYFRLDGSFPRGKVSGEFRIVIDYLDRSAGAKLVLEYDGSHGPYSAAPAKSLEGTGNWKSASFTIRDAVFEGRQNDGADFRFSLQGGTAPLALRSVRVILAAANKSDK